MKRDNFKYFLIVPTIIVLAIFTLYPFIYQIYLSFSSASIATFRNPQFAGLQNFFQLLVSPGHFWGTMKVTFTYVIFVVTIELLLGIVLALFVYPLKHSLRIVSTIFLLPLTVAPVFLGALGRLVFHGVVGPVPYHLSQLDISIPSYMNPNYALLFIGMYDIWVWTPFMFIIILAGLRSIPTDIHEAGDIDGASKFSKFRYIVFPLLRDAIIVALIFRITDAVKTFDIPFILTQGGPGSPVGSTTLVSIFIYYSLFAYDNFGVGAATAILLMVIMSFIATRFTKIMK